jgi:hypothetical protein
MFTSRSTHGWSSGRRILVGAATGAMIVITAGGLPAQAAPPSKCVAANGAVRTQSGGAICEASGTGSTAVVHGDSQAVATGGDRNKARVRGDASIARAVDGDNNTAIAVGDDSSARANNGDGNTAIATADDSNVRAGNGDNNSAIATEEGTTITISGGDNNTAIATSPDCQLFISGVDGQTQSC